VPSIDAEIERCLPLIGVAQMTCWVALDQLVTEQVVPYIPYIFENDVRVVSARVRRFSFDQSSSMPALDRIVLRKG
jgi:hypothetical protein